MHVPCTSRGFLFSSSALHQREVEAETTAQSNNLTCRVRSLPYLVQVPYRYLVVHKRNQRHRKTRISQGDLTR